MTLITISGCLIPTGLVGSSYLASRRFEPVGPTTQVWRGETDPKETAPEGAVGLGLLALAGYSQSNAVRQILTRREPVDPGPRLCGRLQPLPRPAPRRAQAPVARSRRARNKPAQA